MPHWAADPRYATNAARVRGRDEIVPEIAAVLRKRKRDDWLALLTPLGVPCGPINTLDQVFADPQAIARGLRLDLPHSLGGIVPQVATPIRYDDGPLDYTLPPPLLGEHTKIVLCERLGLAPGAIDDLAARGIVGTRP